MADIIVRQKVLETPLLACPLGTSLWLRFALSSDDKGLVVINLKGLERETQTDGELIVIAIDWLAKQNFIEVRPGTKSGYLKIKVVNYEKVV